MLTWLLLYVFLVIFFYYFRFVGRLFVKGSGKPVEILAKLNEMAGFSSDEEIDLFEVIWILLLRLPCSCIISSLS